MRDLIRKLLREEMLSAIDKWRENLNMIKDDNTTALTTLIGIDDITDDKLYLFVSFVKFQTVSDYSYSFMVLDKNNKPITGYMTERNEVKQYMPEEIKNKKQIFPIIKDMTRELMDAELPQNIYRKTVEPVDGDSLKRYEEITNIMVNEYGYKLIEHKTNKWGETSWKLTRETVSDNNKEMNESYEITHEYSTQEKLKKALDPILPLLKNYEFKPLFVGSLKRRDLTEEELNDYDW
jgi:hypothetical protein